MYDQVMTFLKVIHHSAVFKERLQELISSMHSNPAADSAGKIRSVRAAMHRMESAQTPLGRFVLYNDAMFTLAAEIVVSRRERSEGKIAAAFLDFMTDEKCIVVAMLADAGDESTLHLRCFDTEQFDVSKIGQFCADYQHRLDWLFLNGNCRRVG